MLAATDQITGDMSDTVFLGELGLDGAVRHTVGILAMVAMARERDIKRVLRAR